MADQARGHLYTTTGASAALLASAGFVPLNVATMPALVSAGAALSSFDIPQPGRLRYIGALAATFTLTAGLTVNAPGGAPVNFAYRIARNGVTIEASEQTRSQWALIGHQGLTLQALVLLTTSDYVEVFAAVSADATLDVLELSLLATADQPTAEVAMPDPLTTAGELAQVQAAITTILTKGQSYTINGREFKRGDLAELYKRLAVLQGRSLTETRGGIRWRQGVPS